MPARMQARPDTDDLTPPVAVRWSLPTALALGVHLLLVMALTWGISWQKDVVVVAEAEIWSAIPQFAAPKAVEPDVERPPTPTPPAVVKPAPAPPPPVASPPAPDPDIALARQRKEAEKKAAREKEEQKKAAEQAQLKAEKDKADELAKRKAEKDKAAEQARLKAEQEKADKLAKAQAAQEEAQREAERKKNIERMLGQAKAMGGANATGNAQRNSGPSASYAGKLVARIRPNIVFTDVLADNPRAEVEVRSLPDGTIIGHKLLKSSGHRGWDEAVLRAIERTGQLPKDEDGRVPSALILGFRPQD